MKENYLKMTLATRVFFPPCNHFPSQLHGSSNILNLFGVSLDELLPKETKSWLRKQATCLLHYIFIIYPL